MARERRDDARIELAPLLEVQQRDVRFGHQGVIVIVLGK
jgi:hypothetical protein